MSFFDNVKKDKLHACHVRQRDTGWGYAIAYWFPYAGLWHIITRRTLTPFMSLITVVTVVILVAPLFASIDLETSAKPGDRQDKDIGILFAALVVMLATGTVATKLSIDWDRKRGKELIDQTK